MTSAASLFNVCLLGLVLLCSVLETEGMQYGKKCSLTEDFEQILENCKTEPEDANAEHPKAKQYVCMLQEIGWIDTNYVVSKDGVLASIPKTYIASESTIEKLTIGFTACFIGAQGTAEESQGILVSLAMMQRWACDAPPECKGANEVDPEEAVIL